MELILTCEFFKKLKLHEPLLVQTYTKTQLYRLNHHGSRINSPKQGNGDHVGVLTTGESQTKSYLNAFFCSNKFAWLLTLSENVPASTYHSDTGLYQRQNK